MLNYETPEDSGLRAAGNIGVRFVQTSLRTQGATLVPSQADLGITDAYDVRCAPGIPAGAPPGTPARRPGGVRSEEHTSELQSLMRISSAAFCLKKKKRSIS